MLRWARCSRVQMRENMADQIPLDLRPHTTVLNLMNASMTMLKLHILNGMRVIRLK